MGTGLETLAGWAVGKILIPVLDRVLAWLGRGAPQWLDSMKQFAKRMQLKARVTDEQIQILASISGYQRDYAHIAAAMAGRLDGDELLDAVTHLQALGLINRSRLSHPPAPGALLTVSSDAALILMPPKRVRRPKARSKDVAEAVSRRKRFVENEQWLRAYDVRTSRPGYTPTGPQTEAKTRRKQFEEDGAWLETHGFGRDS